MHAIGELLNFGDEQPKRTQASGEQQLKRTEMGNLKAVTKQIDVIGEQQLKWTQLGSSSSAQSCPAPDYSAEATCNYYL